MLVRALVAVLAVAAAYGFYQEKLFAQSLWAPEGIPRFLGYAALYWCAAGILLWRSPGKVLWLAVPFLLWCGWWSAPVPVAAVLFFLGSCYALGRFWTEGITAVLAGAAVWLLVLWTALHFPVNYWPLYVAAFALPYLWHRPSLRIPDLPGRPVGVAMLIFLLGAHLLTSLKPEISSDGLGMHLVIPAWVADRHVWPFDHQQMIWSLMPAGGDALYTGVYLLGGEAAAKLLNFAFLALIAALLVRRVGPWPAALFVSTPLVQLVTGALFVENIWAAFLFGALLALEDRHWKTAGLLTGTAVAAKLIAGAFAVPLMLLALWRGRREGLAAWALAVALAAPPYAFAYLESGNPIFPFANHIFQSAAYDATTPFTDPRYADLHPSWTAPYDITFRSTLYIEGQSGAAGFQYFLLLLPAAIVAWRRQGTALLVMVGGSALILAAAPNLRYLYPALPIATLVLAELSLPALAVTALIALNLWFLPSSGYYNPEFALFRKSDIQPYLLEKAPTRLLIDRLNREHAGEAVAFFATDGIAQLKAPAYTDTWHNEPYWKEVRNAPDAAAIAEQFRRRGIRHIVGPTSREAPFHVVRTFLNRWLDAEPDGAAGRMTLFRLRDTELPIPKDTRPLAPGIHDDSEPRIEYTGSWLHDWQFPQPVGKSLSYSDTGGDKLSFTFEGSAITYIFTRAANRGVGEIWIDGKLLRRVNLYDPAITWQASNTITGLPAGTHTFELRVTGRKDRRSAGSFVDLDAVRVE